MKTLKQTCSDFAAGLKLKAPVHHGVISTSSVALALAALITPVTHESAASAQPKVPTIEQLAAYPAMSQISVASDGKHIVALQASGEDQAILVFRSDDLSRPYSRITSNKMKISAVQFIKPNLLAVRMWQPYDSKLGKSEKNFLGKLYITDLQGKNWNEALRPEKSRTEIDDVLQAAVSPRVLDTLPGDPNHILVVNQIGEDSGDIFKVDLRNNRKERVQRASENTAGYVTDNQGELRARTRIDVERGGDAFVATEFRDPTNGSWSEHFRSYVKNRDQQEVVGFSPDPDIAYVLSNVGEDKAYIYEYRISQRQKGEVLFKHKFFDATGVRTYAWPGNDMYKQGQLLGVTYAGPSGYDTYWTDPQMQAIDDQIRSALDIRKSSLKLVDPGTGDSATIDYDTGMQYSIRSISPDRKTIVIATEDSQNPPAYYLIHNGKLTSLAKSYPDIDPNALGNTSLVYYKARDGLDIPAFLTKPSAELCGSGPWPTVIHPHGGPWARDNLEFDASMWVPLMSSRCMAVLQPQYRGSDGWGRKLWMAGDNEWGQKMQDDKDDGAKWLIEQKVAIPGRIAMFGFSYGGYASMVAPIRPNGIYKCAIAGAGVSDIRKIWAKYYTNPYFRQAQDKTVDGLSPVDKADQIQIPVMVYHGDRDQIVPIEQSRWFVEKAKKSGQPVEYHEIKDYAHGPAWTRAIMADQLRYIDNYFKSGCGGNGL